MWHRRIVVALMVSLIVIAGCGGSELPANPTPSSPSETPVLPTATRTQPTPVPTQTPALPTNTPFPPTATPVPPTATPVPPTEAPPPTPESARHQPSIVEVLTSLEGLSIDEFLVESYRQLQLRDPDILFINGFGDVYGVELDDRFTDMSADYIRETQELESEILSLLRAYDRNELTTDQKTSYAAREWYLATHVRGHAFADFRFLINPVWGLQHWPIEFLLELPLESGHDVETYIARIASLELWVDQVIEGLKRNENAGAIPPRYVLEDTIDQVDAILKMQGTQGIDARTLDIYTNLRSKIHQIDELSDEERESLLTSALTEVEDTFVPAYQSLRAHLVALTGIAVEDPNEWHLPGGDDYYAYLLDYYTGTDLRADEIHALALAEVAKIQADIWDAAAEVGYPSGLSMAELNQRMDEDIPRIIGTALRQEYERLLADADQAAEGYFDLRTSAEVVIRSVREGPPAYYMAPEPGSSDPGVMPVNLSLSPSIVNYNEHVLVHHETIPGHHTQIALAQELDLPLYQRIYSVHPAMQQYDLLAYTEGWAWYGEVLAWEMGLYEGEPLANLGRLRQHLLRTVRAVVDTGIHAKGWTLDEAAAYVEDVTGMPQNRARMTRYVVNPGYSCSYNVAKLKFFEMRQRAEEQLGERFDIKEFHNTVLGNGILPIGVLENVVDGWIEAKLNGSSTAVVLAQLEGLPIDEFFEQSYRQLQLRDPDALFINGLADEYGVANDRFTNMSDGYVRQTQQLESAILDLLRTYDRSALPGDQQLSYDVYAWYLDDLVRGHTFMYYDYPVNSMTIWGKQNWLIDFMVSYQPIRGKRDAEDYVARLSQIDTWVEQLLEGLKLRERADVVPPRYILEESIRQIEGHLQMQATDSFQVEGISLYTLFRDKLEQAEGISARDMQSLLDSARAEVEQTFLPAFLELREYLVRLKAVATEKSGVWRFPDGDAYYAYMLGHETSTDLSPDEVHRLGLAEVTRLQSEMLKAAVDIGYPQAMGLAELERRLAADSQVVAGDALLAEFQRLIDEADRATEAYFDLRPRTEVVIKPEPFGSGIAYYVSPPLDGSGPGTFFANLDGGAIRYILPTVTFHETIPGHHLQIALARELDLPTFGRELVFNAHAEGWALYAEQLAWDMGLYADDALGNLGRLEMELARAARLVIDTGIHAKGWTRQEAAAYYAEATGRPASPSAMNRYVILPGQGCGYTIGLLKILELRQRAMDRLGDEFDIQEFHNVVLGHGSVPLEILEWLVDDWIEASEVR